MPKKATDLFFDFDVQVEGYRLVCPYPCLGILIGRFFREADRFGLGIPFPSGSPEDSSAFDHIQIDVRDYRSDGISVEIGMLAASCTFSHGGEYVEQTVVYAAYTTLLLAASCRTPERTSNS